LMCLLTAPHDPRESNGTGRDLLMLFNASGDPRTFTFPEAARKKQWRLFIDTANQPPDDVFPNLDGPPPPPSFAVSLTYRSLQCFVAEL